MAHLPPHVDPATAEVPTSSGMPPGVRYALAAGLIVILGIMALTAYSSGIGHVWPWTEAGKVKL